MALLHCYSGDNSIVGLVCIWYNYLGLLCHFKWYQKVEE